MSNIKGQVYDGKWFTAEWDSKPTEKDPHGCDGLYIKSIHIKWWGYPIGLLLSIKRGLIGGGR